jgi:hypothetical protein
VTAMDCLAAPAHFSGEDTNLMRHGQFDYGDIKNYLI